MQLLQCMKSHFSLARVKLTDIILITQSYHGDSLNRQHAGQTGSFDGICHWTGRAADLSRGLTHVHLGVIHARRGCEAAQEEGIQLQLESFWEGVLGSE